MNIPEKIQPLLTKKYLISLLAVLLVSALVSGAVMFFLSGGAFSIETVNEEMKTSYEIEKTQHIVITEDDDVVRTDNPTTEMTRETTFAYDHSSNLLRKSNEEDTTQIYNTKDNTILSPDGEWRELSNRDDARIHPITLNKSLEYSVNRSIEDNKNATYIIKSNENLIDHPIVQQSEEATITIYVDDNNKITKITINSYEEAEYRTRDVTITYEFTYTNVNVEKSDKRNAEQ